MYCIQKCYHKHIEFFLREQRNLAYASLSRHKSPEILRRYWMLMAHFSY